MKSLPPHASRFTFYASRLIGRPAVRQAFLIFVITRLFLTLWAILAQTLSPLPTQPDELLRPYLGEPILNEGLSGLLLGPWQRFDTMHYLRIARQGYADAADSVFPPLYPLAIRSLGFLFRPFLPIDQSNLLAAILLANTAMIAAFALLYQVASAELPQAPGAAFEADASAVSGAATRTLVYLALFPTGFYWLAPYTEPIFLLFVISSLWAARRGRPWTAGLLGILASLTRLTGWVLIVPLAYEYARQHNLLPFSPRSTFNVERAPFTLHASRFTPHTSFLSCLLPPLALVAFLAGRAWSGLPPLATIYHDYWYQTTNFPGLDVLRAIGLIASGKADFTLIVNLLCLLFLLATTILTFRRLGPFYGLYSAMLLLFILLPTSELKPLFSFSRYTLAFFPTFILLAQAGRNPWLNRLILYPSLALYLYFSGQFFIWGWVA